MTVAELNLTPTIETRALSTVTLFISCSRRTELLNFKKALLVNEIKLCFSSTRPKNVVLVREKTERPVKPVMARERKDCSPVLCL
uniref:Uncharacterized protein n=1 Tax=Nelumbo nucifera TaxID=4432 RepID=A0A822ZSL5_NELNU|nr:TPA_asm: hypothetical protein HUJ06_017427 [Nelumbo nucifera]